MTLWFVKQETAARFNCGVVAHAGDSVLLGNLAAIQREVEATARAAFPLDPDEPVESWPIRLEGPGDSQHLMNLILEEGVAA
jgi:hypothetical protein